MTATKIFEINATYKTYETGEIAKVLSRSMNRLTILINGETLQKRFKLNDDGVEFLQISKWETVYADDVVCDEEPQDDVVCDEDFQFTITVQACVLFTVTVNNDVIIEVKPMADDAVIAAFIGQHNLLSDDDMSMFTPYLESALKIKESDGLIVSINRRYGNGNRIATVEVIQSLIGREVVFQKKHHATVIHEFKAEDDVDREYGEDWIKIQFDNGKITSLSATAKTLQYL
jgi:hypothetical protein